MPGSEPTAPLPGVLQLAVREELVGVRLARDIADAMAATGKKAFEIVGETGDPPLPPHTWRLLRFLREREQA